MAEESVKPERTRGKAHCASCGGVRNCDVRGHFTTHYKDENIWAQTDWHILQCMGCEATFFQTIETSSEDYVYEYNQSIDGQEVVLIENITYYPAILKRSRPEWLNEIHFLHAKTKTIFRILLELYSALENNLIILASIGTRTAFDAVSIYLEIPEDLPFSKKLAELVKVGNISDTALGRLETLVEVGHAAAHRGWAPDAIALASTVDILEQFIHDAIVLPERRANLDAKASQIKATIPAKKPRPKAGKSGVKT